MAVPRLIQKREQTLELLEGPSMQVTLIASTGAEKAWTLPKALLAHHSGYFTRTRRFKEGEQGKVTLESFEPDIFKLFIEFLYYGRYSNRDDLDDETRIRDSAKAWVLGDYLDAVGFQNFAMRDLYSIYFPTSHLEPKSTVGPETIDYCCAMTPVHSKLYQFFCDVLIVYWHKPTTVIYNVTNRGLWDDIWVENFALMSEVLFFTNQPKSSRQERQGELGTYLLAVDEKGEPVGSDGDSEEQ